MDVYCIERTTLLDNPSIKTLEGPDQHTVHCLADVDFCYESGFEVLLDPEEGETTYTRGWRVDDAGRDLLLDLARETGRCSTCKSGGTLRKGFRAAMNATVLTLGSDETPPLIQVQTATPATPDVAVCGDPPQGERLLNTERPTSGTSTELSSSKAGILVSAGLGIVAMFGGHFL